VKHQTRNKSLRQGKTFGIWGFVATFVLIALVGLAALLVIGTPNTPTEPVSGDLTPNTSLGKG
jgi:hypothetical protein